MYFADSVTLGMSTSLNHGFRLLLNIETIILDLVSPYFCEVKRANVSERAFVNSDAHLSHCYVFLHLLSHAPASKAILVLVSCM